MIASSTDEDGNKIAIKNVHLRDLQIRTSLCTIICREIIWGMVQHIQQRQQEEDEGAKGLDDDGSPMNTGLDRGGGGDEDVDGGNDGNWPNYANNGGISNVGSGIINSDTDEDCDDMINSDVYVNNDEGDEGDKIAVTEKVKIDHNESDLSNFSLPLSFGSTKSISHSKRNDMRKRSRMTQGAKTVRCTHELPRTNYPCEDNLFMALYSDDLLYPVRVLGNGPSSSVRSGQHVLIQYLGYGSDTCEIQRNSLVNLPSNYLEYTRELVNAEIEKKNALSSPLYMQESPGLLKYWDQRLRLFSKYDNGILLDEESWYSVTPEIISNHISKNIIKALTAPKVSSTYFNNKSSSSSSSSGSKIKSIDRSSLLVLDLFSGCGGNSISMASAGISVMAVEIDPIKAKNCRHNASVYGVQQNVDIIVCDVYDVLAGSHKSSNSYGSSSSSSSSSRSNEEIDNNIAIESSGNTVSENSYNDYISCRSSGDIAGRGEMSSFSSSGSIAMNRGNNDGVSSSCGIRELGGDEDVFDCILMSPPWGGPEYSAVEEFRLRTMIPSGDGVDLIVKTSKLCRNIVYIIPYNTKIEDIQESANRCGLEVMVEDIYLYAKLKLRVAYYGEKFAKLLRKAEQTQQKGKKKKRKRK